MNELSHVRDTHKAITQACPKCQTGNGEFLCRIPRPILCREATLEVLPGAGRGSAAALGGRLLVEPLINVSGCNLASLNRSCGRRRSTRGLRSRKYHNGAETVIRRRDDGDEDGDDTTKAMVSTDDLSLEPRLLNSYVASRKRRRRTKR